MLPASQEIPADGLFPTGEPSLPCRAGAGLEQSWSLPTTAVPGNRPVRYHGAESWACSCSFNTQEGFGNSTGY